MAKERNGQFPVVGDRVLAEDGSVWTYDFTAGAEAGHWEQQDPAMSLAELEAAEQQQASILRRLSEDHRVYALAFGAVRMVKREQDLNESDPTASFVLALAQSALRDSIVAVVSDDHQRSDLEARTGSRLRSFLGDPEWGTVQTELGKLRMQIADETMPEGVAAKTREPLTELAELAGQLPLDSDARASITRLASARRPSERELAEWKIALARLPDKLFRELVTMGVDVDTASRAQGAATQVVQALIA